MSLCGIDTVHEYIVPLHTRPYYTGKARHKYAGVSTHSKTLLNALENCDKHEGWW